jgi:mono/diheme cytochrome c family protein
LARASQSGGPMTPPNAKALLLFFLLVTALAVAAGCYTGPDTGLAPATSGGDASTDDGGPPSSEAASGREAGARAPDGLPCDVSDLLASSCIRCHGARPSKGAPMSLVTYDDLVATWDEDPRRTIADVALERMKATQSPMPPDGALAPSAIDAFAAWVNAGTPKVACGAAPATSDAGPVTDPVDPGPAADGGAAVDAGVCTSGTIWASGSPGSALMAPGKRCLACHSVSGGPSLTLAGTVYPTLHEPDGCNGVDGGASVVIVDAAGKSHTLPVNAAGNFLRVTGLPMPYTARVVRGTKVREMRTPQTDGDCNGCHGESGTQSPGRIMAP